MVAPFSSHEPSDASLSQRPLFPVRHELDALIEERHLIKLDQDPESVEWLQRLATDGLTTFDHVEIEGSPYAEVPDDFVPFGRRLNAAGEEHFEAELTDSISAIAELLMTVGRVYGRGPVGQLGIADFGFLRAKAKAELIPPYVLSGGEDLSTGIKIARFVHGTTQGILHEVATDTHAPNSQRVVARRLMDRRRAS